MGYAGGKSERLIHKESPMKKYIVKLTDEERNGLERIISTGKDAARKILHARNSPEGG